VSLFAVKIAEVATPDVLVVAVFTPPANDPLGPELGAANVTTTPLTGLPCESLTVATSGAKAVPIFALCGVPEVATMLAGAALLMSRLKVALTETAGLLESVTVTTTELVPGACGVPVI
jgi:hypothetical protein